MESVAMEYAASLDALARILFATVGLVAMTSLAVSARAALAWLR
jgi:hypothetical protein